MNIQRQQDQQAFTTPNATIIPLATPRLGTTQTSVIRQHMPPIHANPTHTQTTEEIMVVLQGTVQITVQGETNELQTGDTLTIPAGMPHSLATTSEQETQWLIIFPTAMQFHGPDGQLMSPDWAK